MISSATHMPSSQIERSSYLHQDCSVINLNEWLFAYVNISSLERMAAKSQKENDSLKDLKQCYSENVVTKERAVADTSVQVM